MRIFRKEGDFAAFLKLLEEARRRTGMRILGWCLMGNHWHLVLWPRKDGDLSRFMMWLCTTHVRRWREHRGSSGEGHLYQGRFKSFAVQADDHLLTVLRYVEANALRAGLVKRAEDWRWSSLRGAEAGVELAEWPVDKPGDWLATVNGKLKDVEVERLRTSVKRGRPYGAERWMKSAAKKLGAEASLRDPWRPRKGKDRGAG
jgi:putative transposase